MALTNSVNIFVVDVKDPLPQNNYLWPVLPGFETSISMVLECSNVAAFVCHWQFKYY